MKRTVINAAYMDKVLPPMPEAFAENTEQMLRQMAAQEEKIVKKKLSSGLVLAVILLLVLASVALAALNWGSKELLTRQDEAGNPMANEAMVALIQPVGEKYASEALSVEIIDAIYDGRSVTVAWTVKNRLDTPIFLICNQSFGGGAPGESSGRNDTHLFIQAGETLQCGISSSLLDNITYDHDTCAVTLDFLVMTPLVPTAQRRTEGWRDDWDGTGLTDEEVAALMDEGVAVFDGDWPIQPGEQVIMGSTEDMFAERGIMEKADTLAVAFTVAKNAEVITGRVLEGLDTVDCGDYTLQLVQAELAPGSVVFLLEAHFETREAADRFHNERSTQQPLGLDIFKQEDGSAYFDWQNGMGSLSVTTIEPQAQPDGTWIWAVQARMTGFTDVSRVCTIIPKQKVTNDKIVVIFD